ncbi:putative ribonuclease H protein [Platanthera guangdongensis]|uniref:Ribonuclease H protein n=1 Tax=Platanthera guangdongensis TaxID=2320717 RepID=A0ABR2MTE4_9ASPA
MICIIYRSSAAIFPRKSHVSMMTSLYGLQKAGWEKGIKHTCTRVVRIDNFLIGYGIRCFSTQESETSRASKYDPKPPVQEESDAFYVVRKGDIIGIYKSLSDCQAQVSSSQPDGLAFLSEKAPKKSSSKKRLKKVGADVSGDPSLSVSSELSKTDPSVETRQISCKPMSCILEFDGASKGNPGKAGAGAVLRKGEGCMVSCIREGLGTATNNVAEYRALILGMNYALKKGFKHIQVQGDSQLICMQVQDRWQIKNQDMAALHKEVKRLKEMFQSFSIIHVKRGFNAMADTLASAAVTLPDGKVCEDCGPFT